MASQQLSWHWLLGSLTLVQGLAKEVIPSRYIVVVVVVVFSLLFFF